MIGKLIGKVFEVKTKAIVNKLQKNPKVHGALTKYKKDTEDFKERIDRLGIGSWDDLIAASKKNPNMKDLESDRERYERTKRELGFDQDPPSNESTRDRLDRLQRELDSRSKPISKSRSVKSTAKSTTQTKKKSKVQPKKTVKSPRSDPTKPKTAVKKATSTPTSYIAEIRELASLRDDGIITDEEFETKKKNLLK